MPCGLGFEWSRDRNIFKKTLITDKQMSVKCIQWIDSLADDPRFIENGKPCKIEHGWRGAEKKIGNYIVDGYVEANGYKYVLEFNGCYHHGYG